MHLKYNNKNKLNGHNGMLECRGNGKEIIERQKRIFLVKSLAFKRKWQFHEICFFENFSWHLTNRLKPDYVVARFRKDIQSESLKNAWVLGLWYSDKASPDGTGKIPPLGCAVGPNRTYYQCLWCLDLSQWWWCTSWGPARAVRHTGYVQYSPHVHQPQSHVVRKHAGQGEPKYI